MVGCARNSVLEVEVNLPKAPDGMRIIAVPNVVWASAADFVQADAPDATLPWLGTGLLEATLEAEEQTYAFSLESADTSEKGNRNINFRVAFCSDPTCVGLKDPLAEVWFVLNEPFHKGVSSSLVLDIPEIPIRDGGTEDWPANCSRQNQVLLAENDFAGIWKCNIDRCEINACGDETSTTFCNAAGQHLCDAE